MFQLSAFAVPPPPRVGGGRLPLPGGFWALWWVGGFSSRFLRFLSGFCQVSVSFLSHFWRCTKHFFVFEHFLLVVYLRAVHLLLLFCLAFSCLVFFLNFSALTYSSQFVHFPFLERRISSTIRAAAWGVFDVTTRAVKFGSAHSRSLWKSVVLY